MVRLGDVKVETRGTQHAFEVQVFLNDLDSEAVRIEIYADGASGGLPVRQEMTLVRRVATGSAACLYSAEVPATRPPGDYTPRVLPHYDGVATPLEESRIVWQRR